MTHVPSHRQASLPLPISDDELRIAYQRSRLQRQMTFDQALARAPVRRALEAMVGCLRRRAARG